MKCKAALLLLTVSCTPIGMQVAEEVLHEAAVAEEAVEADLHKTSLIFVKGKHHKKRKPSKTKERENFIFYGPQVNPYDSRNVITEHERADKGRIQSGVS